MYHSDNTYILDKTLLIKNVIVQSHNFDSLGELDLVNYPKLA